MEEAVRQGTVRIVTELPQARGLAAGLGAFLGHYLILLAPAYFLDLANFTMGTSRFHPEFLSSLGGRLVLVLAVALLLEQTCRRGLLDWLWQHLPPVTAIVTANLAYLGCGAGLWFWLVPPADLLAVHHDLIRMACLGLGASLLYLQSRGVAAGTLWAGLMAFIPLTLFSNVDFNAPSMFYYVAGHPLFPLLEAAAPPLATLLILAFTFFPVQKRLLETGGNGRRIFAEILFWLGFYTLLVKFIGPIAISRVMGEPWQAHVMWDFWWAVHWILGLWLWQGRSGYRLFATAVSIAEIAIILVKYSLFLLNPVPDVWHLAWFVNKIAVLACFLALAIWLVRAPARSGADLLA